MSNRPHYKYEDFLVACKAKRDITWIDDVLDDARQDFGILTFADLLDFIANNGLENLKPQKPLPWEKNKNPNIEIIIDGYEFKTGCKHGYIAFFFQPITKKWIIKSFHISDYIDTSFGDILKEAIFKHKREIDNDSGKAK